MSEDIQTPFEKVDKTLTRTIGIGLYRAILLALVAAQFYLSTTFVKRSEFEKLKEDVTDIKFTLRMMAQQDLTVKDHETRIRVLEHEKNK